MVDAQALIDPRLAHVIALVLGGVGVAALLAGAASPGALFFWLFYMILWTTFLELFEEDGSFWRDALGWGSDSSSEEADRSLDDERSQEDPVAVLKRRYAAGEIDDEEFETRLDALLETPDTTAELALERERT